MATRCEGARAVSRGRSSLRVGSVPVPRGNDPKIAVLALATFASGTEAYVYTGLLSDVAHDLEVDLASVGLLTTSFAIIYAALAPLLASLTPKLPRRKVLTAGLATLGAINLAASLAPSFGWLVASRIACGMIATLVGPSASAAASALVAPEQRGRAMAMVSAGLSLAFTLGVPLGSAVGSSFGWRATFVFTEARRLSRNFPADLVKLGLSGRVSGRARRRAADSFPSRR